MDENNKYQEWGGLSIFFGIPGIICIVMGYLYYVPEGNYGAFIFGICSTTVAVLPWVGMIIMWWLTSVEESKKEKEKARREEKKQRAQAKLKEKRHRVLELIRQTENIIQKAIIDASNIEEPLWLSALLIIEDRCHNLSQEFEGYGQLSYAALFNPARWQDDVGETAKEISTTLSEAQSSILELKEQAEILSIPPPKEPLKEKIPEGGEKEPTHYDILGIPPSANQDEIKRAYREKIMRLHSDRISSWARRDEVPPEVLDFLEDTSKKINNAYEVLSDIAERGKYDEKIKR